MMRPILSECAVFVNRGMLERDGIWDDDLALRALLAHEHGHPLSENETVHAARELAVEISEDGEVADASVGEILHLLADQVCVHAPQEVFANEIAIRAGFGSALFHLDRDAVAKARLGVSKRPTLVQSLAKRVAEGKLSADQMAALLLVGDLQAHVGFALETAAFLRAGHPREADALEAVVERGCVGASRSGGRPPLRNAPRPLPAPQGKSHAGADKSMGRTRPWRFSPTYCSRRTFRFAFKVIRRRKELPKQAAQSKSASVVACDTVSELQWRHVMKMAASRSPKVHAEADVTQYLYCVLRCASRARSTRSG